MPLYHMCYGAKFGGYRTSRTSVRTEIRRLYGVSRLSRSLNVIRTDLDRSVAYDFLFVMHSNHGPISYRLRANGRFSSKVASFFPPLVYLMPPVESSHLGIL